MCAKGLKVACVTSERTDQDVIDGVTNGMFQIVMFTPEMILLNKKWRNIFKSDTYANLQGLVIDEAHTIKKWWVIVNCN